MNNFLTGSLAILLLVSCTENHSSRLKFSNKGREVPAFSSDSAYQHISDILNIGDRVPGTPSHTMTKEHLLNYMQSKAGNRAVYAQNFTKIVYGDTLRLTNIIAAFNPLAKDRILLCAHWDSRPRSEEDPEYPEKPLPGADDGGSGVAVLMELARQFSVNNPPIGVDIVLFDGEDYGMPDDLDNYFLGSRYWAANPPVPGYSPRFGILLDMVGAENAVFPKEGYSMAYAPNLVNEVWEIGALQGKDDLFIDETAPSISDDHTIINMETNIPMIDIINLSGNNEEGSIFPVHWHTQKDDIEIIDKEVLEAVGNVLMELIYNRL
ncbi:M28 family peptidase [Balneola sp. MJW-20]|uniref:M28 family peptidase n=1 Tax=Gracilimonas aurantiaca TaxID=3234185 RepID=UPI003465D15F